MTKIKFTIALLGMFLSSCAQQKSWYKEGSTEQDFYKDKGQCNAQAFSVASGNMMQIAIVQNSCMQGKGWQLVPVPN